MALVNTEQNILKEAIQELEEAKNLITHDCKVAANQKIDFVIAAIKAKIKSRI